MASVPRKTIEIFFSYSHKDQRLRDQLDTQLSLMTREGLISSWFDHKITAGNEWAGKIDDHLNKSQVILLLISPDFIASDYCYDIEMKQAMVRHEAREARVIPIILRPCDWHKAPFSKLKALPTDGKPVTTWTNRDRAYLDIAIGIRKVIEELATQSVIIPQINKQTVVSSASKKIRALLVNDNVPKHVLLNPNDPLPPGYISIVKGKEGRTIALKPTLFQSLEALLDDLYLSYLSNQYEPDTYGGSWILASRTDLFQRLIAPWNWLLPFNRNKPTSLYSQGWQSLSPETYGLTPNTTWEIINPSDLSAFGLVTNEKRVADYSSSIQGSKSLYRLLSLTFHTHQVKRIFPFFNTNLFSRVVPPETIKPDDYRYTFIFTASAASLKDGRAIILDK